MAGSIMGQVLLEGCGASPGARVVLTSQAIGGRQTFAKSDGWFKVDQLPTGLWTVHTLGASPVDVHVLPNSTTDVTLTLGQTGLPMSSTTMNSPRGSVRGRVIRGADGLPVRNATVIIISSSGSFPDIAPITNDQGEFALDGLAIGLWIFRAVTEEGETGENLVAVHAGGTTEITVTIGSQGLDSGPAPH